MEITEIFIDTNYLRRKNIKDFATFDLGTTFQDFVDFLGTNDVLEFYKINVSEITIEELKKQICDEYNKNIKELNDLYNKFRNIHDIKIRLNDSEKYIEVLEKLIVDYLESNNIGIIELKNILFENIIKRAINKRKPFLGEDGKSDKGFKDAVLWESIIEYAKKADTKKFILLTKNPNDFTKILEDEFNKVTGKEIEIIYEISKLQEDILRRLNSSKNILILDILEDNQDILIDKMNCYFEEFSDWKEYKIENIMKIEDFVNKGNNFYSFMIFEAKDGNERQWYVEIDYTGDELNIDSIVPCA